MRLKESAVIARLRRFVTHPAARGLIDDAAVYVPPLGRDLVITHDQIAAGIHYTAACPPSDVAWKLVAVNLSDLAAKGAVPVGVLVGLTLSAAEDADWFEAFARGLDRVLATFGCALLGGDTVLEAPAAVFGCTAIGTVEPARALSRAGARPGDALFVTGTIGDAGLGLDIARGQAPADKVLLARYRRPTPRLAVGAGLAGLANAAMDVSDGLLIDAARLAAASRVSVEIALDAVPLSDAAVARSGDGTAARLAAASAGDDYELLFTVPEAAAAAAFTLCEQAGVRVSRIGRIGAGEGLVVTGPDGRPLAPERLGFEHGS